MERELIKPYNEIMKSVELYNKIVKLYYEQREAKKAEYEEHLKLKHRVGRFFKMPTIINELHCDIDKKEGQINLSFFADGKRHLLFQASVVHWNAYRNLGIMVDFHLNNVMEIALEHDVAYDEIQKDYNVLIKQRYKNLCQLAEQVTKARIEKGIAGHLTVFYEPTAHCDDPIKLAEYEDGTDNTRAYCRPKDGVEYYSAMQYFLSQTDVSFIASY